MLLTLWWQWPTRAGICSNKDSAWRRPYLYSREPAFFSSRDHHSTCQEQLDFWCRSPHSLHCSSYCWAHCQPSSQPLRWGVFLFPPTSTYHWFFGFQSSSKICSRVWRHWGERFRFYSGWPLNLCNISGRMPGSNSMSILLCYNYRSMLLLLSDLLTLV